MNLRKYDYGFMKRQRLKASILITFIISFFLLIPHWSLKNNEYDSRLKFCNTAFFLYTDNEWKLEYLSYLEQNNI